MLWKLANLAWCLMFAAFDVFVVGSHLTIFCGGLMVGLAFFWTYRLVNP